MQVVNCSLEDEFPSSIGTRGIDGDNIFGDVFSCQILHRRDFVFYGGAAFHIWIIEWYSGTGGFPIVLFCFVLLGRGPSQCATDRQLNQLIVNLT